jgi:putative endonuclease
MKYYFTYVLKSNKDNMLYYGQTKNLKLRIEQHIKGMVQSTQYRRPLELIYFEGCLNKDDALKREKYFKTYYRRMFVKKRLTNYFISKNSNSTG